MRHNFVFFFGLRIICKSRNLATLNFKILSDLFYTITGLKEDVEGMKTNFEEMIGKVGQMEQQFAKLHASMGHSKLRM